MEKEFKKNSDSNTNINNSSNTNITNHAVEIEELKELLYLVNTDYLKSKSRTITSRFNPVYNRVFNLYTKYIPIDTGADEKLLPLIKELMVIKKSTDLAYNVFLLNAVFFSLLYLVNRKTNYLQLMIGGLGLYGLSFIGTTWINYKFSFLLNPILSENIKYTILRLESGQPYYEQNKIIKQANNVKLAELDNKQENLKEEEYSEKYKEKESMIEFYSNWLYSPINIELENKLYFAVDENGEHYKRNDIFMNLEKLMSSSTSSNANINLI